METQKMNLIAKTISRDLTAVKITVVNDMIANNIDLNTIKQKDVYFYNGQEYKVGQWLFCARHDNVAKSFSLYLESVGFNFENKLSRIPSRLKIAVLLDLLSSGRDINSIITEEKYTYRGKVYNIGQWIQNAKHYGVDPIFRAKLQELGYELDKSKVASHDIIPETTKVVVLKDMIANGIDINNITSTYTYTYEGKIYKVGMWLQEARKGNYNQKFCSTLVRLGFNLKPRNIGSKLKFTIIKEMVDKGIDISKLSLDSVYQYEGNTYNVGEWIYYAKRGVGAKSLLDYLTKHGVKMFNKTELVSVSKKLEIIDDMLANGFDINKIGVNDSYTYQGYNYNVGNWLAKARSGQSNVKFIQGLTKYGFILEKKSKYYSAEYKLQVINDMINNGIDINDLKNNFVYNYKGTSYSVGIWIKSVRAGSTTDKVFIDGLISLGFTKFTSDRTFVKTPINIKVKVLKDIVDKGRDINRIGPYYVYKYNGIQYDVGKWLYMAKKNQIGKKFRNELLSLGLKLEESVNNELMSE